MRILPLAGIAGLALSLTLGCGAADPSADPYAGARSSPARSNGDAPGDPGSPGASGVDGGGKPTSDAGTMARPDAGTGTGTGPGAYTLVVDKSSVALALNESAPLTLTLHAGGFSGPVSFAARGVPTAATVTFSPQSVTLSGTDTATVTVSVKTGISTAPGTTSFTLESTASDGTKTVPVSLEVRSSLRIEIPLGVNRMAGTTANPMRTAFGPYPTTILAPAGLGAATPVTIVFYNADIVAHEIHAGAKDAGFPHGASIPAGTEEAPRHVIQRGTYDYYLHDQGAALTVGRIIIQ